MNIYSRLPRLADAVRINPWISERFVVAADINGQLYKLFQVLFPKNIESVFVDLSYFSQTQGILTMVDQRVGVDPTDIDMKDGGHLVSHPVKYHHPADGEVHFSKESKIYSRVRRQATPLSRVEGHQFTVYINGIQTFESATQSEQQEALHKRSWLVLPFGKTDPGWIKVIGYCYTRSQFLRHFEKWAQNKRLGPNLYTRRGDSVVSRAVIAAPMGYPAHKYVILIEAINLPDDDFNADNGPRLLFLGGFDERSKVKKNPNLCFITALYPASNIDELRKFLPMIDYQPPPTLDD